MSDVTKREVDSNEKSSLRECERHHELTWRNYNKCPCVRKGYTLIGKCLDCYAEYIIHLERDEPLVDVLNTEEELYHFEMVANDPRRF